MNINIEDGYGLKFNNDNNSNKGAGNSEDISLSNNNDNSFSYNKDKSFSSNSSRKRKMMMKQVTINPSSAKYVIFVVTLWIVAFLSFIIGFILHYGVNVGISGSAALWVFCFVVSVIASIYTYLYKKAQTLKTNEEKLNLLKYFPVS